MNRLRAKFQRRASRYLHQRPLPAPQESIVSLAFDDCPRSVLENALPLIESEGWRATIYIAMGLCGTTNHLGEHMSIEDVKDVASRGHEIAGHTFSHLDATEVSVAEYLTDIDKNQAVLTEMGLGPTPHFAYPYGDVTPAVKRALTDRFATARGVIPMDGGRADSALLPAQRFYSGPDMDDAIARVEALKSHPEWLNLFSHDVRETPSEYGCTPYDLKRLIASIRESGAVVTTVGDAHKAIIKTKAKAA